MGSFAFTCSISGLPIEAGDAVRYLLLTQGPYDDSRNCGMNDSWFPRCFPIQAKYNDYGAVENWTPGAAVDLISDSLAVDIIERGWGDNAYHDVPTSKRMSFTQILDALPSGRILVRRSLDRLKNLKGLGAKPKTPKGVPTRRRVQKAIEDAKLPLYQNGGPDGYMVDKKGYGLIRVRWGGYGPGYGKDAENLQKVQQVLGKYATMICAGNGSYAHRADLMVCPLPGTENYHGRRTGNENRPLKVAQCMIREDVWQAILARGTEYYTKGYKAHLGQVADFRKMAHDFWAVCLHKLPLIQKRAELLEVAKANPKGSDASTAAWGAWANAETDEHLDPTVESFLYMSSHGSDNTVASLVATDMIPFTVGLGTNWKLMLYKYLAGQVTDADVNPWLDAVGEFVLIQMALIGVRYWWRPSYSCGPQFGEWGEHMVFLQDIAAIAADKHTEAEEERRKDMIDSAKWRAEHPNA